MRHNLQFEFEEPLFPAAGPAQSRPIHYLGSKLRIIDAVTSAIDLAEPSRAPVCDLFAGSGTVSLALASHRAVTSVDIQEYSRVICSAALNPSSFQVCSFWRLAEARITRSRTDGLHWAFRPLIELEQERIDEARKGDSESLARFLEDCSFLNYQRGFPPHNVDADIKGAMEEVSRRLSHSRLIDSPNSAIARHFGGIYFSFDQASTISIIRSTIHEIDAMAQDAALAALLSTASTIVNTVGKHFAQPLRPREKDGSPKRSLYRAVQRDRMRSCEDTFITFASARQRKPRPDRSHKQFCMDYETFLETMDPDISVVYADPPYTRDHYSRFYHVLETICLADDPIVTSQLSKGVRRLSRGVYRLHRHQSAFCIRSEAPRAFEQMIGLVARRGLPLVLSYSGYSREKDAHPRVMTLTQILDIAKIHYANVETLSAGRLFHSRLNKSSMNKEIDYEAETLIIMKG